MAEKFFLNGEAAAETGEAAVTADNAMARNDDGDGILAVGEADRTGCVRFADAAREFAVGNGFTEGDELKILPNFELKFGAVEGEWEIELFQFASKVGFELAHRFLEGRGGLFPRGSRTNGAAARGEAEKVKGATGASEKQRTDWTIERRVGERWRRFSGEMSGGGSHEEFLKAM